MAKRATRASPAFNLCGGHPVLDLVNTLDNRFRPDGPTELLAEYSDVLRFALQTQLLRPPEQRQLARASAEAKARALLSARQLRETLATVLYAAVDGRTPRTTELQNLRQQFLNADRHRDLYWEGNSAGAPDGLILWSWHRARADAHLPVWMLASAAHELLASLPRSQLRACGVDSCRWLFLDTSKNHSRRWCDMRVCGNRMKAQRFLARRDSSE